MKLLNDFFYIEKTEKVGDTYVCSINLNVEHLIYQVHFPNNPITPGACLLQIFTTCLEQIVEKKLSVSTIKSVKYLSVLSPKDETRVDIIYNKIVPTETGYKVQGVIKSEKSQFVKITISYTYE